MHALCRTVRFAINATPRNQSVFSNGYGGFPPVMGFGSLHQLDITCIGQLGTDTGYLIDIKSIDRAARATIVPAITRARTQQPFCDPAGLLNELVPELDRHLPVQLERVRWCLSPYFSLECSMNEPGIVLMRQSFEFCAGHRLHNDALSPEENRRLFGKCNNLSGHGHNYTLEPEVVVDLAIPEERRLSMPVMEELVEKHVLARFDHKNLNQDTDEFADGKGLNPTVEHIAMVCYQLLAEPFNRAGATLRRVTVWESDRTSGIYPA